MYHTQNELELAEIMNKLVAYRVVAYSGDGMA